MSNQIIREQCQKIHDAVHSGTLNVEQIDAALAELRKLADPPPPSADKPAVYAEE